MDISASETDFSQTMSIMVASNNNYIISLSCISLVNVYMDMTLDLTWILICLSARNVFSLYFLSHETHSKLFFS